MSAVLTFPSLITLKVALAMLFAMGSRLKAHFNHGREKEEPDTYPRCLSIIVALKTMAVGFARFVPMISLAT